MTDGVAAWRRGGVAAWRRGGVAAWRRGDVSAWRRFIPRRGIGTQPRVEALRNPGLYHRKRNALKERQMTDLRAEDQ